MGADRLVAVAGSIVVHLLLAGLLFLTLWQRPQAPQSAVHKPIIQARAVDEATAMEPVRRREAEEQRKREEAEQKRRAAEAEKKRKAAEAEKKRKAAEAEKKRKAAEAEKKRKAAEAEKQRKAAEAEEQRKAAEAEKKRKEDIERRQQEMLQRMEAEAQQMEAEAQQQRLQQLSRQQSQYVAAIQNKVARNWLRPPGSRGTLCTVVINQMPSGDVTGVRVLDCDGDYAFQHSVESAVRKASPLPLPSDKELFQREIEFVFKP